ncbi:MAG: CHAT domain-containing protein [Bacteroidetes bacterium]|nr:CHAT domain-containing protein [Bacteroidota bacterium]
MMLIGGVKYNSDTTKTEMWSYLSGTLNEVEQIKKQVKNKTDYFVSSNANEENVKKTISQATILHISTHGFFFPDPEQVREEMKAASAGSATSTSADMKFRGSTNYASWSFVNNKNPLMRSGLVLAGANDVWERNPLAEGEDGILTAQEVSTLDMQKTKLVVLSACETGLGDIKGSEGVYGLQRAFKMAGVKNIIMSLWQVPDKETSEFMITFYKKLTSKNNADVKTAFNETQKEMRKKYDPYFWAAFVLVE